MCYKESPLDFSTISDYNKQTKCFMKGVFYAKFYFCCAIYEL